MHNIWKYVYASWNLLWYATLCRVCPIVPYGPGREIYAFAMPRKIPATFEQIDTVLFFSSSRQKLHCFGSICHFWIFKQNRVWGQPWSDPLKSWGSEGSSSVILSFKRSYKISYPYYKYHRKLWILVKADILFNFLNESVAEGDTSNPHDFTIHLPSFSSPCGWNTEAKLFMDSYLNL